MSYREVFNAVEATLKNQYASETDFNTKFAKFKLFEYRTLSDDDYFSILVKICFYSGFKAGTVEKHMAAIELTFPDIHTVAAYTENDVSRIMNDAQMIRHEKKIMACIQNAKTVKRLVEKFGSVRSYIDSYEPAASDENLFRLYSDLQKRQNPINGFEFLSKITAYHFLTDIGMQVMKPDRVILRIFQRLGLIRDREQIFEAAVVEGRKFSRETGHPIRYIDVVFVKYGQAGRDDYFGLTDGICLEKHPKCNLCGITNYCRYAAQA
ncbi:MAG: DNA-3-methyladenine glycosylase I [Nitrospirae bacterium]|nr:DNA-3-methyladenine glycosylase I [Nitrospirota bacterium]